MRCVITVRVPARRGPAGGEVDDKIELISVRVEVVYADAAAPIRSCRFVHNGVFKTAILFSVEILRKIRYAAMRTMLRMIQIRPWRIPTKLFRRLPV